MEITRARFHHFLETSLKSSTSIAKNLVNDMPCLTLSQVAHVLGTHQKGWEVTECWKITATMQGVEGGTFEGCGTEWELFGIWRVQETNGQRAGPRPV